MIPATVTAELACSFVPPRQRDSRKGRNGKVLVVGGGRIYHGAPALAAMAALRSGTDLTYAAVPGMIADAVRAASCDVIVIPLVDQKLTRGAAVKLTGAMPKGMDSAAVGMGLTVTDGLGVLLERLINADVRVVLDAGALLPEALKHLSDKNCILTPHAGEFYRLFGEEPPSDIQARTEMVSQKAVECGATILLKGPADVISDGRRVYVNPGEVSAMTAGGTGDVLSGIAAGILSRNRSSLQAAAAAAYVNKHAGMLVQQKTGYHMVASDLIDAIPQVMKPLDRSS